MFLSNEMNSFIAMQKTDFHEFELFWRKSHFRSLNAQITSLELLRTQYCCFSATKQIMRMRGPLMLKNLFLSEKKLLNAILRAKLKYMKMCLSNEMNSFIAMQKTDFPWVWAFLKKKSF